MSRESFFFRLREHLSDNELIDVYDAYWISKNTHHKQLRDGGERYFDHPKAVAIILIDECRIFEARTIIAALLHDALEDTFVSPTLIRMRFGSDTLKEIDMLSKCRVVIDPATGEVLKEAKQGYMTALEGERVLTVKGADRLHNIRTMGCWPKDKQLAYLAQTENMLLPKLQCAHCVLAEKLRDEITLRRAELA